MFPLQETTAMRPNSEEMLKAVIYDLEKEGYKTEAPQN